GHAGTGTVLPLCGVVFAAVGGLVRRWVRMSVATGVGTRSRTAIWLGLMSSPCSSRCEAAMVRALASSGSENRLSASATGPAVTAKAGTTGSAFAAGAVVFLAGVRLLGVFLAGAIGLAAVLVVALVFAAA